MQPTTQPGLDCVQDFGQGLLGIAVGGLVFPKVNFGQGFSLPTPKRNLARGKLPVGSSG
jgi:hypothetical protein